MLIITVTHAPFVTRRDLPWTWGAEGFVAWVEKCLMHSTAPPTLESAVRFARELGYNVHLGSM